MTGEKLRQSLITRIESDGEVAAVDDVARGAPRFYLLDEIAEIRIHFRRATGKIDCRNLSAREPIDDPINRLAGHDFFALRTSVHVTMDAG